MEFVFEIGGFGLRWYSTMVALGLALGAWVSTTEARRRGDDPDHVFGVLFLAIPGAIIGARVYHVIDKWNAIYKDDLVRIFLINEGGIGIYGAVLGAIIALWIYTKWKGLSFARWMDIGAPGLILGQAIGRWGNFFNEELYGKPTSLPWALDIPPAKRVLGYENFNEFHPLFLYESLLNLIAFGVLMYVGRRFSDRLRVGDIALMYGLFYGSIRLGLENLRIDNWRVGDLPVATIISATTIIVCGGALLYRQWWLPKQAQKQAAAARDA